MKEIQLSEIRPQFGTFKLEATGDVVHRLRKVSLDDYEWFESEFGLSMLQVFAEGKEVKTSVVTKIIFHQLEDKTPFLASDEDVITDDGEKATVRVTGLQKFRRAVITAEDAQTMTQAFLKTLGMSQPVSVEAPKAAGKKKVPAGPKSSTK